MNRYDPSELRAHPLAERRSLLSADETLVAPDSTPAVTDAAASIVIHQVGTTGTATRADIGALMFGAR
jgi:hypothetical protein